jgi:cytochrome c-type biogenesis protein CcmF
MPYTLHVLLGIAVFFTFLVASIADPFHAVDPIPSDGPGPNPLLQNHWLMAVHPPTLYLGYVGMTVPFSMICAALLAGRLEAGWMAPLRRFMLIPWGFLTFGIILGGWWSYGVLGWGGYWAWDPVENASFHPWLTGTAFLHSAMVYQRRRSLRDWTLTLGMATFILTLVGTFMTRSGVFNSVHSFTQSDIGPVFLGFIGFILSYSVILLSFRSHVLDENSERPAEATWNPLGREFAILIQNALFTVFTFTVLLGTLYPLIAEALNDRKVSVGEPYFDRWALPIGLAILFMMGVGPSLPWGKLKKGELTRRFLPALGTGFVLAALAYPFGITGIYSSLAFFVCGFALWGNLSEVFSPINQRATSTNESRLTSAVTLFKKGRRRFGGHIAHFGVIVFVIAITLSKGYKAEKDFTLTQGQSGIIEPYTVTFIDAEMEKQPHRDSLVGLFTIKSGTKDLGQQRPRLNYYRAMREPIGTPAIYSTLARDLYISIIELPKDGSYVTIRAMTMPGVLWLWIGGVIIAFGTIISILPAPKTDKSAHHE